MHQIRVENLKRTYRIAERKSGIRGDFAGLVSRRHRVIEALAGFAFFAISPGFWEVGVRH
jgi:ABC-2 type transport system ATP-binding protein